MAEHHRRVTHQRYFSKLAHERMSGDDCPECGEYYDTHLESNAFWLPRLCDLTRQGVLDRIEQYKWDKENSTEETK